MNRATVAIAAIVVLCAPGVSLSAQETAAVQRPSSDLITREQILDTKSSSVYEVIESIHNNWYNVRIPAPSNRANARIDSTGKTAGYNDDVNPSGRSAPGASGGIQVYIDGSRVGGTDELKKIRSADVYSIRRYNGTEAQARFGIGHSAGAIVVSTMTNGQKTP
ncbi:MAG: hypothetical protein JWM95_617 [Gemmatimonadetes bacterium]|nr:hypothetical protein [Gemmatimonadota bacterium]